MLQVGWQIESLAKEEVQFPTAPLVGLAAALHAEGEQVAAFKTPKLQDVVPDTV